MLDARSVVYDVLTTNGINAFPLNFSPLVRLRRAFDGHALTALGLLDLGRVWTVQHGAVGGAVQVQSSEVEFDMITRLERHWRYVLAVNGGGEDRLRRDDY